MGRPAITSYRCSQCGRTRQRRFFSQSQLKKALITLRCKSCTVLRPVSGGGVLAAVRRVSRVNALKNGEATESCPILTNSEIEEAARRVCQQVTKKHFAFADGNWELCRIQVKAVHTEEWKREKAMNIRTALRSSGAPDACGSLSRDTCVLEKVILLRLLGHEQFVSNAAWLMALSHYKKDTWLGHAEKKHRFGPRWVKLWRRIAMKLLEGQLKCQHSEILAKLLHNSAVCEFFCRGGILSQLQSSAKEESDIGEETEWHSVE